jgi:hypothetical protein
MFARLFGRGAEDKRLPPWLLTLPVDRQRTLLRTLWQCDGSTGEVRGYPRATYVTVSPALAYGVHQLLLRQGIAARLRSQRPVARRQAYYIDVTSADGLRRFSEALGFNLQVPEERTGGGRMALDQRYLYLPVQSLREVPYSGPVHNLEVAGAHTYVSSLCYRGREIVKNMVPSERGVDELIALIKADGRWEEPA